MSPKISVLIPVYNEVHNLRPLVDEIALVLRPMKEPFEIVMVDDGSTDGSPQMLEGLCAEYPELKVLLFRHNAGQTAALDAGFRHASGEIIVTMDGDLQNDPHDIPGMIAKIHEGYDFVAGWRKNRKDKLFVRRLPSKVANWAIRRLWHSRLRDLGCALKVYTREIVSELRLYGEMHRFIGLILEGMGARVYVQAVNHRPRVSGRSKYTLTRVYKVLLDLITIWFLRGYRTKPLYVFGWAGGGCLGVGGLSFAIALWQKLFEEFSLNRNPLFMTGIFLFVLGFQFLAMGLLAELLIRSYFETASVLPYSVRKKIGFEAPSKKRAA